MSQLEELPEDYWARQARQNKLLEKLRKIKEEELLKSAEKKDA